MGQADEINTCELPRKGRRIRHVLRGAGWAVLFFTALFIAGRLLLHPGFPLLLFGLPFGKLIGIDPATQPWSKGLTEEQKFMMAGDPRAGTDLERQKSIADHRPENPVCYCNYLNELMMTSFKPESLANPDKRAGFLRAMDRGERLEPDNAYYNFMKAGLLIQGSSKVTEDAARTYSHISRNKTMTRVPCKEIQIRDQVLFQQGIAEFLKGVRKPYYTSHVIDMLEARLHPVKPFTDVNDFFRATYLLTNIKVPDLGNLRAIVEAAAGYSLDLADRGKKEETRQILDAIALLAAKVDPKVGSPFHISTYHTLQTIGLGHAVVAYHRLRQYEDSLRAKGELIAEGTFENSLYSKGSDRSVEILDHGGFLWNLLSNSFLPGFRPEMEPVRRVEYLVAGEVFLSIFLFGLIGLSLFPAMITLAGFIRHRNDDDRPKHFFPNMVSFIRIFIISVGVPVGLSLLYTVLPLSMTDLSLFRNCERIGTAWIVTETAIVILLLTLSYRTIRARTLTEGRPVPPPRRVRRLLWFIIPAGLLAVVIGWELSLRWDSRGCPCGHDLAFSTGAGYLTMGLLVLWIIQNGVRLMRLPPEYRYFRRAFFQSLSRILLLAAIILGLAGGAGLRWQEARVLRQATVPGLNDLEYCNLRFLRDRLVRQHQSLLAEYLKRYNDTATNTRR